MLRMRTHWRAGWAGAAITLVAMMLPWCGHVAGKPGVQESEPPAASVAPAQATADQLAMEAVVGGMHGHDAHEATSGKAHTHAPVPPEYAGKTPPPGLWTNPTTLAKGRAIYTRDCLACHGAQGDGRGPAAADLPLKPPDFRDRAMVQEMTPDYWLWRVMEGGQGVEPYRSMGSSMPPWKGQLREEEAWAVIAYARSFSRQHKPQTSKGHH
jgi:mono/diheme cytochrome c family protein